MPNVHTKTFGPGSLESITLKTWVANRGDRVRMKGRIEGTYTIYCGMGWTHEVEIDTEVSGWDTESDDVGMALRDADRGDVDVSFFFVTEQIGYELDDWFDPCELEDEL